MAIVLASSSPYRQALLERLGEHFSVDSPDIDERRREGESAAQTAARLATEKARAVAQRWPTRLIIASDQVASLDDGTGEQQLGKPGNYHNAFEQLRRCSGQRVDFYTACCLLNGENGNQREFIERYSLYFRPLSEAQIDRYLQREKPYDCAGSIKSEGLGSALITRHQGDDPTGLIGLPLIQLSAALAAENHPVL